MRADRDWVVDGVDWTHEVNLVIGQKPTISQMAICKICGLPNNHWTQRLGSKDEKIGHLMTGVKCRHQWVQMVDLDPEDEESNT